MSTKIINKQTIRIMSVFTKNINESMHGREIARKLKANQKTINTNLNLLKKERILVSRKKGRNIEYSINKENIIAKHMLVICEHYKFIKAASENFQICSIASDIARAASGIAVIYGSYAKGTAEKDSDMDILIVGGCKKERLQAAKNRSPIELHVMVLDSTSFANSLMKKENFIKEIINDHIIIKGFEEFIEMRLEYGSD